MTNVPEKVHAELGASVAGRWMACPGSVRLSRGQPTYETEHSRAGTAAHAVAELCLRKGTDPTMYVGTSVEGVEVDEEMAEAVKVFVDYCRSLLEDLQWSSWWIEHRFSLAELNPPAPMFGTADFVHYDKGSRQLEVVDYKNGSGVVVEVKGNKQLRYYALGAALTLGKDLPIETVKITIVQPRAAHPDGVVRSEIISYVDLLAFAGELMDAARATLDPAAPLVAGSHCRFCPASPICPAQRDMVQLTAQATFEAMPLDVPPAPESMPIEVVADILSKLPTLEQWAKDVRQYVQKKLEAGEEVPGFKLVEKRKTRRWVSERDAETFLAGAGWGPADIFKQELKSPAQIEKLVGKKNLPAGLVESTSSGYTLATDADKRPAVTLHPGDAFEALPAGE